MRFADILSFCFSILGLYGLVYYLRFLIPRNLLPYVSAVLAETEHLLERAESTGVISTQPNDYRSALTLYEAVMPLPIDRHLSLTSLINIVAPVNSCRFGWKAIEHLEHCGNSGLLFGTVSLVSSIRSRHELKPSRYKLRFVGMLSLLTSPTIDGERL
jgi:hypothetical protein